MSDWVFESRYSYWESAARADVIGPWTLAMTLFLAGYLVTRYRTLAVRALAVLLAGAELMSSGVWRFVF